MPPERSLPTGAIFAPSDVTQPQFEANTKGLVVILSEAKNLKSILSQSPKPEFNQRCFATLNMTIGGR
jgi:hypothetical protein